MKKAAIIPVSTIGDALILMIAANQLTTLGYEVTILHDNIFSLKNWFPKFQFKKLSLKELNSYDHIFLEQDEVKIDKTNELKKLIKTKLSIIYFRYNKSKFSPLSNLDIFLDDDLPIAKSLAKNFQKFLSSHLNKNKKTTALDKVILDSRALDTGIVIPKNLTHKKYPKRVIIQPTSTDVNKCWSKHKFIKLAKKLKNKGFRCVISVAPEERKDWLFVHDLGLDLPLFQTLSDLASYIYESSYLIGNDSLAIHLASLFKIDHIMIAKSKKVTKKWQGGWLKTSIISPLSLVPNLKGLRLREKYFQKFISVRKVLKYFSQNPANKRLTLN
ncbi:MAG: hypothetical protein KR126chlam4_00874 [Candidatus Anoxychlamydiales bacterium]|nr:hypothetical protein [Candidatus Anoxychlamydiales bacterium]